MAVGEPTFRFGEAFGHAQVGHTVMKRGRFAAMLLYSSRIAVWIDASCWSETSFPSGVAAEPDALHVRGGARPPEHHLAAHHELDRLPHLPRRRAARARNASRPQLPAETGAQKPGDDADVFQRQPEHLCDHAPKVVNRLRRLVSVNDGPSHTAVVE